jgi:hypothetical protein
VSLLFAITTGTGHGPIGTRGSVRRAMGEPAAIGREYGRLHRSRFPTSDAGK